MSNDKPWEILVITPFLSLHNFYVAFWMQKFLMSFQQYWVIIHCEIIAVVYEKFILCVISTGYKGKYVINACID